MKRQRTLRAGRCLSGVSLLAVAIVALALAAGVSGATTRPSGTLQLTATVMQKWRLSPDYCPPGTPAVSGCLRSVGEGDIAGLGRVTVTYDKILPGDDPDCFILHNNTAVIEVAGKGMLGLSRDGRSCGSGPPPREDGPFEFTVASGSGAYAGASGSLVYTSSVRMGAGDCICGTARDTWTGTLTVPKLDFDIAPPVLTGAVSKNVRAPKGAKRMRVRYVVTAEDAVDGAVAVACKPRSGSFFAVGRTRVACTAEDTSANLATATFTITVKRKH
jgi:hypothetical protein